MTWSHHDKDIQRQNVDEREKIIITSYNQI